MKKFFVLSILCTSLSVQALPNTKQEKVPFLMRCEMFLSASTLAYLKASADVWNWMAYDSNFPIWRLTRKPGTYNTLAIRSNEWAEITAVGDGTLIPPQSKLDISDFTEEEKAEIGKFLEQHSQLDSPPPSRREAISNWDYLRYLWAEVKYDTKVELSYQWEYLRTSWLGTFEQWNEIHKNRRRIPSDLKDYCAFCASELSQELAGFKEAWSKRNDPPAPRQPLTITLYRNLKLFAKDGQILNLKKGDIVDLDENRLVTNVVKATLKHP